MYAEVVLIVHKSDLVAHKNFIIVDELVKHFITFAQRTNKTNQQQQQTLLITMKHFT